MATKKKKTPAKKKLVTKINAREEFLLLLIELSERQILPNQDSLNEVFSQQASRLKRELSEYIAFP